MHSKMVKCSSLGFAVLSLVIILVNLEVTGAFFSIPSFLSFPSFSSFRFALPFGLGGSSESSKKAKARTRTCTAAMPPPPLFEKDFAKCRSEVESSRQYGTHPDQHKRTDDMIMKYGYDLMTYNVTTDDGYILTIFRITGGEMSPTSRGKPSVLLHHGLLTASDTWLLQPQDRNLAFKLADAGYDVWLANARGTTYSQQHVVFDATDDTYWDFGFHEIAMYDIPALIRTILTESRNKDLLYVGHSMGSTIISIALSEMPELNKKVRAIIMLAPAIHIGHSYNPLRSFTNIIGTPIQNWVYHALEGHFDGDKQLESMGLSPVDFCTPSANRCGVCDNIIFFMYGYDAPQANYTNLPNILSKIKNVVSLKTVIHFAQNLNSCQFKQFNYGFFENLNRYGWYQPPSYNLKAITSPVYIFYGESDNFVPPVDVEMTQEAMLEDTIKGFYKVEWPSFNHVDFVVANDADILVYDKILEILESHVSP